MRKLQEVLVSKVIKILKYLLKIKLLQEIQITECRYILYEEKFVQEVIKNVGFNII